MHPSLHNALETNPMNFSILTDAEVEAIHQATLKILAEVGVVLEHPEGREILAGAGASVRGERVLLPPELVERCMAGCPSQVQIRGRGGKQITLGDGSLHWHNMGGARDIFDTRINQRRSAVVQDVRQSTRLLDALDNVTTITPLFTPTDVPGGLMSLAMYRHALPFTTKPLQGPGVQTAAEVEIALQLAEVVGLPAEILTLSVSPISPLIFPNDVVEAILAIARRGIALAPLPCPIAGATAPMSIAGSIAQQNAENLAAIVLAQLARPGLPVIYCGRLAMMEPRTGISVWGGVELGMASAGTVQVGHRYHLPVNVYGFSTNAHLPNIQSGFERTLNAAIPALAGADELSGVGELQAGVISAYAQMVIDNEIIASINRLKRGFAVDDEALGVEVIASAMDGPRNFLSERHTVKFLRAGEIMYTRLADRRTWEEWDRAGRDDIVQRAQAEADRLLAGHEVPPLSDEQEAALEAIMAAAEKMLG